MALPVVSSDCKPNAVMFGTPGLVLVEEDGFDELDVFDDVLDSFKT